MKRLLCATVGLGFVLAVFEAGAEEPRFVPMLGLDVGNTGERLSVRFDGREQHEDRHLLNTRLWLGLAARMGTAGPFHVGSESSLGYGIVHHTGHDLLEPREAVIFAYELGEGFSIPFGLSVGAVWNVEASSRSSVDFGMPLGLRYRAIEVWYRPSYVVPLGAEESDVFTGTRELSARPGMNWFELSLRVRW